VSAEVVIDIVEHSLVVVLGLWLLASDVVEGTLYGESAFPDGTANIQPRLLLVKGKTVVESVF